MRSPDSLILPLSGLSVVFEWRREERLRLAVEASIFALVNKVRVEHGLAPLARVDSVDRLALEHCQDMARRRALDHEGFPIRAGSVTRLLGSCCVSENCATGYGNPSGFVEAWLNSASHRETMMNASYSMTGLGYWRDYATQMFCD